jgi:hypothetical protein
MWNPILSTPKHVPGFRIWIVSSHLDLWTSSKCNFILSSYFRAGKAGLKRYIPCFNHLQLSYYLLGSGPMMSIRVALLDIFMTVLFSLIAAFLSLNGLVNFALLLLASVSSLLSSRVWIDIFSQLSNNESYKPHIHSLVYFLVRFLVSLILVLLIGLTGSTLTWTIMHPVTPGIQYLVLAFVIFHLFIQGIQQILAVHSKITSKQQQLYNVFGISYKCIQLVLPFILVTWICLSSLWPPMNGSQSVPMSLSNTDFGYHFFLCLLMIRVCRISWQNTRGLCLDFLLVIVVNAVLSDSIAPAHVYWNPLNIILRLLIVHVVRVIGSRILERFWMWIISLKHFLLNRKQRIDGWLYYLPIILIISPVTILLSSILDAPAMPILGLPLLWMGFPRPKRMWPLIGNCTRNAQYCPVFSPNILQKKIIKPMKRHSFMRLWPHPLSKTWAVQSVKVNCPLFNRVPFY